MRIAVILLVGGAVLFGVAGAQQAGPLRALEERAGRVVGMKNDFIARVLVSHGVAYESDAAGNVLRLKVAGRWHDVSSVEVIPLTAGPAAEVTGHEIVFTTAEGVFALTSSLRIP